MLVLHTTSIGANAMASSKRGIETVKWDALELEAFNLKFERMSTRGQIEEGAQTGCSFP